MPDLTDWRIRIAHREVSLSRYRFAKRKGDTLKVFLADPREVITITGAENIERFVEEKREVDEMAAQERDVIEGWQNIGGF